MTNNEPKEYQLTKQESADLKSQIDLIRSQEQIILALNLQMRSYLAVEVLPRLKIDPEKASIALVNAEMGSIIMPVEEKPKKEVSKKP